MKLHGVGGPSERRGGIGAHEELDILKRQPVDPTVGMAVNVAAAFGMNDEIANGYVVNRAGKIPARDRAHRLPCPFAAPFDHKSHGTALPPEPVETPQVQSQV